MIGVSPQFLNRVMTNAGVRISESDSFVRKDAEDRTSRALIGSPRTPRAANMAGEAPALVFHHPVNDIRTRFTLK